MDLKPEDFRPRSLADYEGVDILMKPGVLRADLQDNSQSPLFDQTAVTGETPQWMGWERAAKEKHRRAPMRVYDLGQPSICSVVKSRFSEL